MSRALHAHTPRKKWLPLGAAATVVAVMVVLNAVTAQAQAPALSDSSVAPGDTVTVSGNGCTSDTEASYFVTVRLIDSSGSTLDSDEVTADDDGDWSAEISVPSSLDGGEYDIGSRCEGRVGASTPYTSDYDAVTLSVAEPEPEPTMTPTPEEVILTDPTPTPTEKPSPTDEPTLSAALDDPEISLSGSGGRAPYTTELSGTACLDEDDLGADTKVKIQVTNDGATKAFSASVDNDGDWSKSLTFSTGAIGNNTIKTTCLLSDDESELFAYDSLTVTVGSPTLAAAEGSLSVEQSKLNPGDTVKAEATKCPSDSADDPDDFQVRFRLTYQGTDDSWTDTEVGDADGDGKHTASIKLSNDAPVGTYLLAAVCEKEQSDGSYIGVEEYTNVTVTVFGGSGTATPTPTTTTKPTAIPTPTPDDINIGFTG